MNTLQKRRMYYLGFFAIGIGLAMGLILYSLKQNINVFLTPGQLSNQRVAANYHFRLGGMVKAGTIVRDKDSLNVDFIVTDLKRDIPVHYKGVLPDLFHEGKGVITEGSLNEQGTFIATQVLAKHDENYMPKNVYKAIRDNTREGTPA